MTFEEARILIQKPIVQYKNGRWETHRFVKGNNWYGLPVTTGTTAEKAVICYYAYLGGVC